MVMMGQCKLCLQPRDLINSHFLPAGIYRRLRDKNETNPNPWMLSREKAVQTSKQKTAYLLCSECEQRFSTLGEDWVLKHCLQEDGDFPLASILESKTQDVSSPRNPTKLYYACSIPEIDKSALAYFAASIFWRGSVHPSCKTRCRDWYNFRRGLPSA